jgi:hypothetical protein
VTNLKQENVRIFNYFLPSVRVTDMETETFEVVTLLLFSPFKIRFRMSLRLRNGRTASAEATGLASVFPSSSSPRTPSRVPT